MYDGTKITCHLIAKQSEENREEEIDKL